MEMDKMQIKMFMMFLKRIREHQNDQKACGTRPWSMNYIGIKLNHLAYHMEQELGPRTFSVKRAYAIAYKLREMGLVRLKRYKYMSKVMYLTDEGVEYVKSLKAGK